MQWLKSILPPQIRLQLRVWQRSLEDLQNGSYHQFIKKNKSTAHYPSQLSLKQIIRANNYSSNKVHNLELAIAYVEKRLISPGQLFSFWSLIPPPTVNNGFREGRNLVGTQLATDIGGGLCQLSGILYHLSLMAGLEVVERHPHSKDIYTEESRYTPLGSDATVVYGHKDFRIRNNLKIPFYFAFELSENAIIAHLCALETLEEHKLKFESVDHGRIYRAIVSRLDSTDQWQIISEHDYERL